METKLLEYQLNHIKKILEITYEQIEDAVLEEYNVCSLEDLKFKDYDDILEFIREEFVEMNSKYR